MKMIVTIIGADGIARECYASKVVADSPDGYYSLKSNGVHVEVEEVR